MRRTLLVIAAVVGVLAAAAGLWCAAHPLAVSSGWTAYSPLSGQAYLPVIGPPWWSLALAATGSAVAGAALALLVATLLRSPAHSGAGRST